MLQSNKEKKRMYLVAEAFIGDVSGRGHFRMGNIRQGIFRH